MKDQNGYDVGQLPSTLEQATMMFRSATEEIRLIETRLPSLFQSYHDARKKFSQEGVQAVIDMKPPMASAYDTWKAYDETGQRPGIDGVLDTLERIG